eukprot:CAMPEP_0182548034 /NCGR_PEP_ID=MMETSP1323-20130603/38281_1 /TAXON_ID=236787 /ORGANISM="Florenciella parvula, Strain RCC1693" /LENGTH=40 /DNA_ID= /DNA_START= /DNA_END= /DNA_ORIENTATION=
MRAMAMVMVRVRACWRTGVLAYWRAGVLGREAYWRAGVLA